MVVLTKQKTRATTTNVAYESNRGLAATKLLPMTIWWTFGHQTPSCEKKRKVFMFVIDQKLKTLNSGHTQKNVRSLRDVEHVIVLIRWGNLQAEKKGTSSSKHPFVGLKRGKETWISERIASAVSIKSKNITKTEYFWKQTLLVIFFLEVNVACSIWPNEVHYFS
jgi:hypothetical protein